MTAGAIAAYLSLMAGIEGASTDMSANDAVKALGYREPSTIIFVTGIAAGIMWSNAFLQGNKSPQMYCGPITMDQPRIFGLLSGFVARFPETGTFPVGNVLLLSFQDAFPCKQ